MPPVDLPYLGLRAAVSGKFVDKPIVVETEHLVSLCFDGRGLQSTMLRAVPDALALDIAGNVIAFARQSDAPLPPLESLIERADRYRGLHGIDLIETAARIELGARYDWTCLSTCLAI
ncbi:hypothetical protein C7H84_05970 [Burkholderia sp. Nafp2/4-1b]|uniref:hypothetical protein n=1 Tax=Burkholderia sp. Nafp2/4-1b TaxID=2116686 RepID=UPI000EF968F2|nr:hypothetical protein [Burkholderia sp. Nafp2/4-1b]RKU04455.1 hypothetical protein C7H84_05970 [Burkholderia sp. Nafp2/4-1b]